MTDGTRLDAVARLVGDPSRAAMLGALMDGRAWTGRELARAAHVTPSTASTHLQRLVGGELVSAVSQGRHRYYRIASAQVAGALEALLRLAPQETPRNAGARAIAEDLRSARTCYDHLAGRLGVALADALRAAGAVAFSDGTGMLTARGLALFEKLGVT
ncbi:MAG: ArsR/SmtB family transcription factor, partial [Vulcanimicrobiaceae bacterium]